MMSEYDYEPDYAAHPSEHLREWCEKTGRTTECVPTRVQLSILSVLSGCDIGDTEAAHLALATGIDASFWLNLQRKYDEVHGVEN
jgi:hypothetical protein